MKHETISITNQDILNGKGTTAVESQAPFMKCSQHNFV